MRIRVDHRFYLDYLLPLLDQPFGFDLDCGDFRAAVWPWDRTEDLFPDEAAQNLADCDFELRSMAWPQAAIRHRVRDRCMDRINVSVSCGLDKDPVADQTAVDLNLQRAVNSANAVLAHLRAVTGQAAVRPIERYWKPGHDRFAIMVPYLQEWLRDDGSPIPMFGGLNAMSSSGAIRSPETGQATLADLNRSISAGEPPPLERSLLVDAKQHLMGLDLRAAILCISSAIESRITSYAAAQSIISKTQRKKIFATPTTFAERHFHLLPGATCHRSLRVELPDVYSAVQCVYDQRNSLMHGGRFTEHFRKLDELVRHHLTYDWIESSSRCLDWTDSLPLRS